MYSDRDFNIRPEYVENSPEPVHVRPARMAEDDAESFFATFIEGVMTFIIWSVSAVVIFFIGIISVAFLAWLISWTTHNPQPITHKECTQCPSSESPKSQRSRATKLSSPGPRNNLNPQPRSERSSPRQSGSSLAGASAPSFRWVCEEGRMFCGLQDPNGKYVQSFLLENGSISSSQIFPDATHPQAWGCERDIDWKLSCSIQDGQGRILSGFTYDGHTFN